jgi:hypothetical protein
MLPWHDHLNETKPQVPRMVVFRARRKLNVPPQHDNSFYIMVRVLHISVCFFLFIQFSPLFYNSFSIESYIAPYPSPSLLLSF